MKVNNACERYEEIGLKLIFPDLSENEITGKEIARLTEHVSTCEECQEYLIDLNNIKQALEEAKTNSILEDEEIQDSLSNTGTVVSQYKLESKISRFNATIDRCNLRIVKQTKNSPVWRKLRSSLGGRLSSLRNTRAIRH